MKQEIRRLQKELRKEGSIFEWMGKSWRLIALLIETDDRYNRSARKIETRVKNCKKDKLMIKKHNRRYLEGR